MDEHWQGDNADLLSRLPDPRRVVAAKERCDEVRQQLSRCILEMSVARPGPTGRAGPGSTRPGPARFFKYV